MATLTLEDGIFTVGLPTAAAFLMRTSMSAMGSVMLIWIHLVSSTDIRAMRIRGVGLPAGLAQAGDVAAHGGLAQHVAVEAELAVYAARAPGQGTAAALAALGRVARQLLQLHRVVHLLLVAGRLAADDGLQRDAHGGVLLLHLLALGLADHHVG